MMKIFIKKYISIAIIMQFYTSILWAACTKELKVEVLKIVESQDFRDTAKLNKLYTRCNDGFILMLLSLSKGDNFEDAKQIQQAVTEYKVAINALDGLDKEVYDATVLRKYLVAQLDKYSSIKSDYIRRGYLGTRGAKGTRGAGLVTEKKLAIPLNFETASWELKKGVNMTQVKEIANALQDEAYRDKIIYINGYTDTRGNSSYNYGLGEKRAGALKRYLQTIVGLKNEIIPSSEGEEMPICTEGVAKEVKNENYMCTVKEDYYSSRRVEISIGDK